jgi:hypothetical protein
MPTRAWTVVFLLLAATRAQGQDIEPRRWTPLPPGMNVFGAGIVATEGDVFFDPALQIENAEVEAEVVGVSYVRSFTLAGKLARFDVAVPWQHAYYSGLLEGEPASASRVGLMDPTLRISMILAGGTPDPTATSSTVIGAALAVTAPLGEYHERYLINLGQNRWVFRPQAGIVHTRGNWSWELTGSGYFFTENDEFYGGGTRKQDPLFAVQGHVIYSLATQGHWTSLSLAYGGNGQSIIDGNRVDDDKRLSLAAFSYGMPLGNTQSLKFAYVRSRTNTHNGSDTDSIAVAWSLRF